MPASLRACRMIVPLACLLSALLATPAPAQNARWGIFVMHPDGSGVRMLAQIPTCKRHGAPRWSHDGKFVVFEAEPDSGGTVTYLVGADGSGLKKLGDFSQPVWSPDDKQLAFVSESGRNVGVQNLDGKGRTNIATGRSPAWSPDGSRLAVSDAGNVRITNLVTGEEQTLFRNRKQLVYYGFTWFPDGKRLVVVARPERRKPRELLYVSADGEEQGVRVRLTGEMAGFVSFSPDGKRLAVDSSYRVQLLDVEGDGKLELIPGQVGASRDPDWSPDGKWIVFASSRDPIK